MQELHEGRAEKKQRYVKCCVIIMSEVITWRLYSAPCWHSAKHSVAILHYLHAFAILLCTVGINEEVMDSFQDTN